MSPLKTNPQIDAYLAEGCGRCPLGGTPECKVHSWPRELQKLREIALSCGLTEELKWKMPCYTHGTSNVIMISALKDACAISFFKGALLKDEKGVLTKPGENSQAARVIRFTSLRQITSLTATLKAYIREAIALEEAGAKVEFKAKDELALPEELEAKFAALPALRTAFEALTPGRKRGYVLYFTGAKQSATRAARVDKCIPMIMEGRGLHD